jgi:hypothetical protein
MPNWTRGQLKNNAKMNFYKNYWMCVGMALILTLVLMMEPDGPKKEIMLKIRDYTDILPAYGYQGWLSSLFDGLGYWFGVLWSVFSLFIALALLLIKIVVGNVVYVGGIRFFIQNRRENPSAGTIFFGFSEWKLWKHRIDHLFERSVYCTLDTFACRAGDYQAL